MFLIVVVDEGTSAVGAAITVTVLSGYPIVVIVLAVCAVAIIVSFVVISVDIVEVKTIILDNNAGDAVVAVVVDNEGAIAIDNEGIIVVESNNPDFIWDRGKILPWCTG